MSDLFDSVAADVMTASQHVPFGGSIITAAGIAAALRERLDGGAFWKTVNAYAIDCAMKAIAARTCANCEHRVIASEAGGHCGLGVTVDDMYTPDEFSCAFWEPK